MLEASPYRHFRVAYALGFLLCGLWPLFLQLILRRAVQPMGPGGELAAELGYTFTGLSALVVFFVIQRSTKMRRTFQSLDATRQSRMVLRETLLYAALFELSAVYGILYFALQGPHAERYGRTFIALPTIMFLLFVPRLKQWRGNLPGTLS